MNKEELKIRTKIFALMIIRLTEDLSGTKKSHTTENQIIRSGTSFAANYCAACRAGSNAYLIPKITIVKEESDETLFCPEIIVESDLLKKEKVHCILAETDELTALFTASVITAGLNNPKSPPPAGGRNPK